MYIHVMSYHMRMMYMQNMRRYLVRKGSVQRASPEDSTDEPVMHWIGTCGLLKGLMALWCNALKLFHVFCASHAFNTHAC